MGYGLGIDVGTTFTAAALIRDGNVEVVPLATHQVVVPSVIFAAGDEMLFGSPAERRGAVQPLGLAREFKRRLGDPVPLMLSGSPYHADRLTALMAKWVVDAVTAQVGSAPTQLVMTHPANWTEYQLGALRNALGDVGLATCRAALGAQRCGARLRRGRRRGAWRDGAGLRPRRRDVRRRRAPPRGPIVRTGGRADRDRTARRHRLRRGRVPVRPRQVARRGGRSGPPAARRASPPSPTSGGGASTPRRRCRPTRRPTSR